MSRFILLSTGQRTIVDDEWYEYLNQWVWHVSSTGYVSRNQWMDSRSVKILMHRVICTPSKEEYVDHINHDVLDNREDNLRICSPTQNHGNMIISKHNSSGYKGVSWDNKRNKYYAYIQISGKTKSLGRYSDIEDAARAYNKKAKEVFGEFACLNDIEEHKG